MNAIFVDTWAWIALASDDDQFHSAATDQHRRLKRKHRRYVMTDFVLSEVITHLYRKQDAAQAEAFLQGLWESFDHDIHKLMHVSEVQLRQAWQLRRKYDDKPDISFVDFTSMVVMRDLGISEVFTGDAHFEQVGMGFRLVP
jgi:predicted nucleic acid-binding protein